MDITVGATACVHCTEVVRISECPLLEVLLYSQGASRPGSLAEYTSLYSKFQVSYLNTAMSDKLLSCTTG